MITLHLDCAHCPVLKTHAHCPIMDRCIEANLVRPVHINMTCHLCSSWHNGKCDLLIHCIEATVHMSNIQDTMADYHDALDGLFRAMDYGSDDIDLF